jgi:thiamine-phosphate pyrophosphorylase
LGAEHLRLILITDWQVVDLRERLMRILQSAPQGVAIQHRHPAASGRLFYEQAQWLAQACAQAQVPLFINGRLDVALALHTHLHLPVSGLSVGEVREHLPPRCLISCAAHNAEEVDAAQGADLMLLSPVFSPTSKPADARPTLGRSGFESLAKATRAKAVALGGISVATRALLPPDTALAMMGTVWRGDSVATVKALLE